MTHAQLVAKCRTCGHFRAFRARVRAYNSAPWTWTLRARGICQENLRETLGTQRIPRAWLLSGNSPPCFSHASRPHPRPSWAFCRGLHKTTLLLEPFQPLPGPRPVAFGVALCACQGMSGAVQHLARLGQVLAGLRLALGGSGSGRSAAVKLAPLLTGHWGTLARLALPVPRATDRRPRFLSASRHLKPHPARAIWRINSHGPFPAAPYFPP